MSIIVAVTKNGETAIAADTLYLTGSQKDYGRDLSGRSKILRIGSSYIGLAGWSLYQNIIDFHFNKKRRVPALKDERVIFDFFLNFWKVLRERYSLVKDQRDGTESPFTDLDSSFLIANKYGIFDIHGNLTVWRHSAFTAIGSGATYSLGAAHTLYNRKGSAADIAKASVEAAMRFDDACGGEIELHNVR